MVITPVTSAFGYYSGMAKNQLSIEQGIAVADMANDTGDAATRIPINVINIIKLKRLAT